MRYYIVDKEEVLKELNADEGVNFQRSRATLSDLWQNKLEAAKGKSLITRFLNR